MKRILWVFLLTLPISILAQTHISGVVTDDKGEPIFGANVYLKGTYDGASTNEKGVFNFSTSQKGVQTLVVTFLSFENFTKTADVSSLKNLQIKLREDVNTLDAVTINAGTFEAGDNAKVTALKPLDVVTTAGALGDFIGALQTLPGTSNVAEDGRLFVRGGDAGETQIYIDGTRVFTPYAPSAKNIPTRGRFSPFLFKGITFSTGGYSAEYGQALSSVLLLNSIDQPDQEKTDLSFMTVGLGLGHTKKWKKSSFSVNTSYVNLAPYQAAFPDNNTWNKAPQSASGELIYRQRFKNDGLLKLYSAFSYTTFDLIQPDINFSNGFHFGMKNSNLYFNGSYKNALANNWSVLSGISFSNDHSNLQISDDVVVDNEHAAQLKVKLNKHFSNRLKLSFGAEYTTTNFDESYDHFNSGTAQYGFINNSAAAFVESDIFFSKNLATKIGIRGDYSGIYNEFEVAPRISVAYKTSEHAQFSLAYGDFYQQPKNEYLKFSSQFKSEKATHFIANYQFVKNKQIFRIEAYYKKYSNLVKYDTEVALPSSNFSNLGAGYAKGLDIFWRDNVHIKNLDYWLSYSFLDSKRDYKNYPTNATPSFVSKHNVSLVGKYWIESWKSQLGMSFNFASGRTYTNPNTAGFLNEMTKNYHSVNANWAYLLSQQKILYFSISNLFGAQNINGYQYKDQPDIGGHFDRRAIVPSADRFFFVGFFWTISDNKKDNQLNNL